MNLYDGAIVFVLFFFSYEPESNNAAKDSENVPHKV
jgi:hypothetical protein